MVIQDIKNTVRSMVNKCGIEIHRLPKKPPEILPLRTEGRLGLYGTPLGNVYLPLSAPNDIIIDKMKRGEVFEPEIVAVAQRFIKKGTVVLDAGANFGQMSLIFSQLAGDSGTVYSFEAQKSVFDALRKNVEGNVSNIIPYFNAVYFESDQTFYFPEPDFVTFGTYGSYNLPLDATAGQKVTSLKIDDLKIEKPISFFKVDVQGCDLFAMQGAIETIKKHKMPILFEFEQRFQETYQTTFQDYVTFVNSIGYEFTDVILDINYLIEPR